MPNEPDGWILFKHVSYPDEFSRQPIIVAIQKRKDVTVALWNGCIESRGLPTIGFTDVTDVRLEFADDFSGGIGRTIIDHDNFALVGRKILFEYAHDGLFDEAFVIVRVDEYAANRLQQSMTFLGRMKSPN
jgi:hypothetical protein